ncbi:MAG: MGMT family protein [Planctomycetota bacterium]
MDDTQPITAVFESDLGWMGVQWMGKSVVRSTFGHSDPAAVLANLPHEGDPTDKLNRAQTSLVKAMCRHASGRKVDFSKILLETSDFTPFQLAVLNACRAVGWGETETYGGLAEIAGSPRAARAAGSVMSSNRFPIIVPCHRIVAAGHRPGGYTAPGGVSMKERLLVMEGWKS